VLHITFTGSGAGLLRRALTARALRHRVEVFPDNLSFGPIDAYVSSDRAEWADKNKYCLHGKPLPHWPSTEEQAKEFWSVVKGAEKCTVWMTRRAADEYCGFLALVEQCGTKIYDVVDMTDARFSLDNRSISSLRYADPARADYDSLFASARPLQPKARNEYLRLWQALCHENAPLRVIADGKLISVPIDFYDALIFSFVQKDWEKADWIALRAWGATLNSNDERGDLEFIQARLYTLAKAGLLESNGSFDDSWMLTEIRLPA